MYSAFICVLKGMGDEEAFTEMNSSVCGEFCGAGMTLILGTPICLWCHSFYFLILQYFIAALCMCRYFYIHVTTQEGFTGTVIVLFKKF